MKYRTFILGTFSMACIGVAAMAYQVEKLRTEVIHMSSVSAQSTSNCMLDGFETDEGFVGCLQPASYVLDENPPSRLVFFIDEIAYRLGL